MHQHDRLALALVKIGDFNVAVVETRHQVFSIVLEMIILEELRALSLWERVGVRGYGLS